MISWDTHRPISNDDCSFQKKTLCKKRLLKQPQFEWQGATAAGTWFQRKQTCRKPNYVLVMKVWFWLTNEKGECAVLFTAPKMVKDWVAFYHHGCRDARTPCMNMFCLKSCTAHTGFIRFFSQAWIWDFLVMKAMLVDLSMGLWCVIRVTICYCCGMSMAVPLANSPTLSLQHNIMQHNYSNHCAETQYQCNKTIYKTYKLSLDWRLHCAWCTLVQPCKP